jgi:type IV pilus assembly protein PilF
MENDRSFLGEFLMTRKTIILLLGFSMIQVACVDRAKRSEEAMVHFQIAQQLIAKDESTQALSEAIKAAATDPDNAEIQNFLGLLYAQRAENEKAEACFRKSIHADGKYSEARNNLCWLLAEKGSYDEAIQQCTQAVENVTYATPERAYHNMGIVFERKGDVPKAIDAYKKGLIHNKNFVKSLRNLSKIYLTQNAPRESFPLLEAASKACNASPRGAWGYDCPEVHYQLAMLYVQMKKRDRVIAELKDCVKADDEKGAYGQKCRTSLKIYQ